MSGIFYGLGLGPGDPGLLTVKALTILKQVDLILAPVSQDGRSLAAEIVKDHLPDARIEFLEFPMTEDRPKLKTAWQKAITRVANLLVTKNLAFVTLGDPLLYGTYLNLYQGLTKDYADIKIITVPGIPGMCAAAAGSNYYLAAENDRLLLITGKTELAKFEEYCLNFETVVIYKPRSNFGDFIRSFYKVAPAGTGVVVERCGMAGEKITCLSREYNPATIDYFTIAIFHPGGLS